MWLLVLQLSLPLTPEQVEAVRKIINQAREAASDQQPTPASPPKFAPLDGGQAGGGVPPIGDKSFTGGGNPDAISDGAARAPRLPNPKRCLCGPECPYCTGDCTTCDCIYEPLPKPGPGRVRWERLRERRLRSRF